MTVDFKDILEILLPDGPAWDPTGDFKKLLAGIAENSQNVHDLLSSLAYIRDPRNTTLLQDLEKEFGVVTDTNLTEAQRRARLVAIKYAKPNTASKDHLQNTLVTAGFTDAVVIPNSPTIDPDLITNGEWVVNGPIYTEQFPAYYKARGSDIAYRGHFRAYRGYFLKMGRTLKTYDPGDIPQRWRFVFFVGSAKSGTWPSSPTVTALSVPEEQEAFLKYLILKHKPNRTWCLLCANYT